MEPRHETVAPAEFARAIEVFSRGFSFARSFTHPYLAECRSPGGSGSSAGTLWVLRDAERRTGTYRKEEWVSHGMAPADVHDAATSSPWRERARTCRSTGTRGGYGVCAIHATDEPDRPLRDGFKALGYRLGGTEPFMIHRLRRIPRVTAPAVIRRVRTKGLADRLAKAARSRHILPEHLGSDTAQRQYAAMVGDSIVGWVGSIAVGDATWCQNMYVAPAYRRRGIARAMLCRLLRDDRAAGTVLAVLLASHTGAKLYASVGYTRIGTLLFFTPSRKSQTD